MEFLLVPIVLGAAFGLLAIGQFFGKKKQNLGGCSSDGDCNSCSNEDLEFYNSDDDPGFKNVAELGNPNRKNRFIDTLDFKPERFK